MTTKPEVIFLPVDDNRTKVVILCTKVQELFLEGKTILIRTPSKEAADFLDKKLWSTPSESFVPHSIVDSPAKVPVAISCEAGNVNNADTLINLMPGVPADVLSFKTVVELFDVTSPEKEQQSAAKRVAYNALTTEFGK